MYTVNLVHKSMNSSECIKLFTTFIVIALLAYSAVDRVVISSNEETGEILEPLDVKLEKTKRPWENCQSPERYIFLKRHKCASR